MKATLTLFAVTAMLTTGAAMARSIGDQADDTVHQMKDAVTGTNINKVGADGSVTISGEVISIDTLDNEFTVRDKTGEIDVEQTGKLGVKVGDNVVISGTVMEDMGEKEIAASKITVTEQTTTEDNQSMNQQ